MLGKPQVAETAEVLKETSTPSNSDQTSNTFRAPKADQEEEGEGEVGRAEGGVEEEEEGEGDGWRR